MNNIILMYALPLSTIHLNNNAYVAGAFFCNSIFRGDFFTISQRQINQSETILDRPISRSERRTLRQSVCIQSPLYPSEARRIDLLFFSNKRLISAAYRSWRKTIVDEKSWIRASLQHRKQFIASDGKRPFASFLQ